MAENLSAPHWAYFKTICDDVEKLGRFVELSPANFGTFSIEIVRLIFATCSEIDVVLKLICRGVAPESKAGSIGTYFPVIQKHYPEFFTTPVLVASLESEIRPWENWKDRDTPPGWWTANNKVKHQRNEYFDKANIGNLLGALGGLCVVLCYYQQFVLKEYRRVWPSEFVQLKVPAGYSVIYSGFGAYEPLLSHVDRG